MPMEAIKTETPCFAMRYDEMDGGRSVGRTGTKTAVLNFGLSAQLLKLSANGKRTATSATEGNGCRVRKKKKKVADGFSMVLCALVRSGKNKVQKR